MSQRLVYVVGPSGAGKDSVLSWLRAHTPASASVHWARRIIDRPASHTPDAENHLAVDTPTFEKLLAQGELAMHWQANAHHYGIHTDELEPLKQPQTCVVVNGSRAHLPTAAQHYPGLTVVHITAHATVLRDRLLARARESQAEIEARLSRQVALKPPPGCNCIEIQNTTTVADAGQQLLAGLRAAGVWPQLLIEDEHRFF